MNAQRVSELFDADAIVGGEPAPLTRSTGYLDILAGDSEMVNIPGGSMTMGELRTASERPGYGLMTGGSRNRRKTRRNRCKTHRKTRQNRRSGRVTSGRSAFGRSASRRK